MKTVRLILAYWRSMKASADLLEWLARDNHDYLWAVEFDRRKAEAQRREVELNRAKFEFL